MSRHHNGNQVRVLEAVRSGLSDWQAIAKRTRLTQYQVTNALRRLHDNRNIERVSQGRYRMKMDDAELTEWIEEPQPDEWLMR